MSLKLILGYAVGIAVVLSLLQIAFPAQGSQLDELQEIHDDLMELWTPVDEPGEISDSLSGYEPFSGDCDDYTMAAMSRLLDAGYDPVAYFGTFRRGPPGHLFACTEINGRDWCLDNRYGTVRRLVNGNAGLNTDFVLLRRQLILDGSTREYEDPIQ
jgi:hypothetical protein